MQTSNDYILLGVVLFLFFACVALEYTGLHQRAVRVSRALVTPLLFAPVIVLMGRIVHAPALEKMDARSLSGTYRFRASSKDHSVAASGDLDRDWFEDISREAVAIPISRGGKVRASVL
jgi:hypothetical protein